MKNESKKRRHLEIVLYPEKWSSESIVEQLESRSTVDCYAIALHDKDVKEDGTPIEPHYHVYIHFNETSWSAEQVAKWFDTSPNKVNFITSDKNDKNNQRGKYYTLLYYTHSGEPEKHQYDPRDFVANFDVAAFLESEKNKMERKVSKSAQDKEIDLIISKCAAGEITPHNYVESVPPTLYARIKPLMERAWSYHDQQYVQAQQGRRNCTTIYAYGESGVGKSLSCRLYAEELGLSVYKTTVGKNPMDEYADEEAIILDDVRPFSPFSHLEILDLTDPHHISKAQARYRNKLLKNSYVFITSVFSPKDFWDGFKLSDTDSINQFYRRLSQVWHVKNWGIDIFQYVDGELKRVATVENPVPVYLATRPDAEREVPPANIFRAVQQRYQSQLPKQFSMFDESGPLPF